MSGKLFAALAVLFSLAAATAAPPDDPDAAGRANWAKSCKDWDEWTKPGPPFRVFGNTYYVGTCGISAILVADGEKTILIDGGPAKAAGAIAANIEKLGFKLSDVEFLLHTHEHLDHVGGLAELQRRTGGALLASAEARPVLESGKASPEDPQFGILDPFPPAKVTGVVEDGEEVRLTGGPDDDVVLTPLATPGHTLGAFSWHWRSCQDGTCKQIVYADSLSAVSNDTYRYSDHPQLVAKFRKSLDRVAALDCDILLAPHPTASGMREKLVKGDLSGEPRCKAYAEGLQKKLDERLAKEAADAKE